LVVLHSSFSQLVRFTHLAVKGRMCDFEKRRGRKPTSWQTSSRVGGICGGSRGKNTRKLMFPQKALGASSSAIGWKTR